METENLNKTFDGSGGTFHALHDVSINIDQGECIGVIGESGSGKSTLAGLIAGLLEPSGGKIVYDGVTFYDHWRRKGRWCPRMAWDSMQMIFQSPYGSFSPRMKIGTGIREGLNYRSGIPAAEQRRMVDSVMERVGLPLSYKEKYVYEISGGEAQRAAIARAVISKPKLLLCDEITSALDAEVQEQILALLRELREEMGMAVLLISHDIRLVMDFCSRVYVMKEGRIVEEGRTEELLADPQQDYTKRLIAAAFPGSNYPG